MQGRSKKSLVNSIVIPKGKFCGHNCADGRGCVFWNPYKKDGNGRQYCNHYGHYYYPHERQGCLSYKEYT